MNEQQLDALPPVNPDQSAGAAASPGREALTGPGNLPGGPTQGPAAPMVSPQPNAQQQAPTSAVPPVAVPAAYTPAIADDVDLIEKEWVERAKQIVEHTKHDPYIQNEEMTKMKADYLKKRYNRDIKKKDAS